MNLMQMGELKEDSVRFEVSRFTADGMELIFKD